MTTARRGSHLVPTAVAEPPVSSTASSSGDTKSEFDWHNQWYPVAFLADLDDASPLTFTLLGEPLVFWRDPTAKELTYRCTADRCPHRLVPLSEGRVNEKGEIECGYHGWSFDGNPWLDQIHLFRGSRRDHRATRFALSAHRGGGAPRFVHGLVIG